MKVFSLTQLFCIISICSFGQLQPDSLKPEKNFSINPWEDINGLRLAAGYFNDFEFEASYLLTSFPKRDPGLAGLGMRIQYIGAGIEYLRIGQQDVFGAKLSYENTISILAAQVGADFLASDTDFQIRVMPKLGVTLFGVWTLYYGYNFNLVTNTNINPSKHLISLQYNILNYK